MSGLKLHHESGLYIPSREEPAYDMPTPQGYSFAEEFSDEYVEHYILFPKDIWGSNEDTRKLREYEGLHFQMRQDVHEDLHRNVEFADGVPLLGEVMARHVLVRLSGLPGSGDPLDNLDKLTAAVYKESIEIDRNKSSVQRELAKVVYGALLLQRPYIESGAKNAIS